MTSGAQGHVGIIRKLVVLGLCLLFTGCLGMKKTTERSQTTTKSEVTSQTSESVKETKTNRAINENMGISLRTGDSLVDARIRQAFMNFNYRNQSGSNSTEVRFDKESMALLIANIIGETQEHKEVNNNSSVTEKSFEQQTEEYIKTKIKQLPWWAWLITAFFLLPQIMKVISMFINPLLSLIAKKNENNKN